MCPAVGGVGVYVHNVDDYTMSVIDTATDTVTATVPVGFPGLGVAADPDGGWVYGAVQFSGGGRVVRVDPLTST